MKAAKCFIICEIVCFVGLALSYAGNAVASDIYTGFFQEGIFRFGGLILLFAVCNLICAIVMRRQLSDPAVRKKLWRWVVVMKLVAIPMFLLNFFFGLLSGLATMVIIVLLPVVLLQMLVAWFAMMASSGYCIALVLYARKQGAISTGTAVRQVISQFIYVVDVISLFFIRKTVKECKTAQ